MRPFVIDDLRDIKVNRYGDKDAKTDWVYTHPDTHTYTLESSGIKAIMMFYHTGGGEWLGFYSIALSFDMKDARELKRFTQEKIKEFKPKRVWTLSKTDKELDKWHKFIGFTLEKENVIFSGERCNMWSMVWE